MVSRAFFEFSTHHLSANGSAVFAASRFLHKRKISVTDWLYRIFIIEGCVTIFASMACWPVVPPFPENCNFLSSENKALMLARIKADGGHVSNDEITFKKALSYLTDWKIWAG